MPPWLNDRAFTQLSLRCPSSVAVMWSATRSACATIVSPGLTAADDGKNDASTTNRFSTSWARQNGSSTDVARIGAEHQRAALVRGVPAAVRVRHDQPEAEPPQDALGLRRPARWCAAGCSAGSAAGCGRRVRRVTRLSRRGRSSDITSQSTPRATHALVGPQRNPRIRPSAPSRRASAPATGSGRADSARAGPAQVEVVDRHGLLEHRVVRPERMEALHHRRQVRHVAPADQPRRVRQAVGMRGRSPTAAAAPPSSPRRTTTTNSGASTRDRLAVRARPRPPRRRRPRRVGDQPARAARWSTASRSAAAIAGRTHADVGLALRVDPAGERVAGVAQDAAVRLAGAQQAERQRRRVQPLRAQLLDDRGHAGGVRHRRVRIRAARRLGRIDAVLRRARDTAARRGRSTAPACRSRSATPARRRRGARPPGSPRAAAGRARCPRTWCCRRRCSACTAGTRGRARRASARVVW